MKVRVTLAAAAAGLAACSSSPNVACATTDVPLDRDVATATRSVEVASAAVGMDDVPTSAEQRYYLEDARDFSLNTGGGKWVLTRVSRSELVDFVDVRTAVAALEDEGFEQERTTDAAGSTYVLRRGDQRATVSLGDRLRGNDGKVEVRVQVDTGCRPT
jgi:hypothetical protein